MTSPITSPNTRLPNTWWCRKSCASQPFCCQNSAMKNAPAVTIAYDPPLYAQQAAPASHRRMLDTTLNT